MEADDGLEVQTRIARVDKTKRSGTARSRRSVARSPSPPPFVRVDLTDSNARLVDPPTLGFPRIEAMGGTTENNSVHDVESIWLVGVMDHEAAKLRRRREAAEDLLREYRMGTMKTAADVASTGTPRVLDRSLEQLRLGEMASRRYVALKEDLLAPKPKQSPLESGMSVYEFENKKLRKVLRQGRKLRQVKSLPGGRSGIIDDLLLVERAHGEAAVKVQRFYRNYRKRKFWKDFVKRYHAAKTIQAMIRGVLTRKLVRLWHARRVRLITLVQASARGVASRDVHRRLFKYEAGAAIDIQRAYRGYAARMYVRHLRRSNAALAIQRVWRGVRTRAAIDKQWIAEQVIVMQSVVRRFLVRKRFAGERAKIHHAAAQLQRLFRGFLARRQRDNMLWERESELRELMMRVLRSDQAFEEKELKSHTKRLRKANLDEQINAKRTEWGEACEEVRKFEFDLVGLERERVKVSPRAIEQGWVAELEKSVKEHREWVTDRKLKALFGTAKTLRQLEHKRFQLQQRVDDSQFRITQMQRWWLEDRDALWARASKRKWALHKVDHRKQVAQQKRKWRVRFFTASGKPDMKRPEGKPWKAEDFPDRHSTTFNIGTVQLRAIGPEGQLPIPGVAGEPDEASAKEHLDAARRLGARPASARAGIFVRDPDRTLRDKFLEMQHGAGLPRGGVMGKDFETRALEEIRSNMEAGAEFRKTMSKLEAQSASAQFTQYGSMLKPMMATMEQVAGILNQSETKLAEMRAEAEAEAAAAAAAKKRTPAQGFDISAADGDEIVEAKAMTPRVKSKAKAVKGRIPWHLLDELEAERQRFQSEQEKPLPFSKRRL